MSPVTQAWIELNADDPEAVSAFGVAQSRLAAGRGLTELRRVRLVEIVGTAPTDLDLPSLDASSDVLKTVPRRADIDSTFAAAQSLLGAVGAAIESDESTLEKARTVVRLKL